MSQFRMCKTIAKLDLIGCSWSHSSRIPALPGDAWNHCYHLNNSCPSNGWWQCKNWSQIIAHTHARAPNIRTYNPITQLFFYILLTKWQCVIVTVIIGGEGSGDRYFPICCGYKHSLADFVRDSAASCDGGFIRFRSPYYYTYLVE